MHTKEVKSILTAKTGTSLGLNPYRGCTHGCIYCDARSTCYQMQHEFEDIEVKINAPELLYVALKKRRKKAMIGTGAMCDPYLPLEAEYKITKQCLDVIEHTGYGVTLLTKSDAILRDLEQLVRIHQKARCVVQMTLTTYDDALCAKLEPHVAVTSKRLKAIKKITEAGIPVIVWLCPILPWINDTEENIVQIVEACAALNVKGILHFGMGLTLREGNREYFYQKLDDLFPGLKAKYQQRYGNVYEINSPRAAQLEKIFKKRCQEHKMMTQINEIFDFLDYFPEQHEQISLF